MEISEDAVALIGGVMIGTVKNSCHGSSIYSLVGVQAGALANFLATRKSLR
jgi:hypothetical protein